MNVTTIGLDIAKSVFHVIGAQSDGKQVLRKKLRRGKVLEYFVNLPPAVVGLEACGGAQYWARELKRLGHDARLIHPKYVKAFLRGNKNDYNDAGALCEAVAHGRMRFVPVKTEAQQELQALHRLRQGLMRDRTALANRARGLLSESGRVLPKGVGVLRKHLPELLEDAENGLSATMRHVLAEIYGQLSELDERIRRQDRHLAQVSAEHEACRRLDAIPGFGAMVCTALVAAAGDGSAFQNGRHLAAWLGLVPRQHSTGGEPRLLGISKRGDKYLRALIIHGARAVVRHAAGKTDPLSRWIQRLQAKHPTNVVVVALANKLTRIAWVVLSRGERYAPRKAAAAA